MDSGSLQNGPFNNSDDEGEEFYSVQTRQRTAAKRKNIPTRKPADEIELHLESALLGESGLGLTAEEFSTLPNSERRQLLEAVLQSKEEYKMQERKAKSERLDEHTETSANKEAVNSMPVKLECSIPLSRVVFDTTITHSVRPSLNKFRLKRPSDIAAEDIVETIVNSNNFKKIRFNEDYLAESEASVAELVSCDEHSDADAEKCKLTADELKVDVTDSAEKKEDSGLRKTVYLQDFSGVQEAMLTCENNVQLRTRNGERFSTDRETRCRCLLLENDDNNQVFQSARDVSASLRKAETAEEKFQDRPDSLICCQLIRKYRVQATDERPLFKQNGLDLKARVRIIYDYYTDCEIRCYESDCKTTSGTQWGKPIAIELDKGKASTRNRKPWGDATETEQTNDKNLDKTGNQTSDCDVYSALNNENEKVRKRLVLPVEQIPCSTASSESLDAIVELDNLWIQEDIETRLRKSRQTKIGGGLVEDEGAKISRRKMPKRVVNSAASDDENDPDFVPENTKRQIHVDRKRSQKPEKPKKRRLGMVKSTVKHSRKTEEQVSEGSKGESRNLAKDSSWQDAGKFCANNSHAHSSASPEDFYETRSAVVSTMEKHKFVNNTLIKSSAVNHEDLHQCQVNADLEDSSPSSLIFEQNSSFKNDTKQQVFPVFQTLVRPCLRENEENTNTSNSPFNSKTLNSKQNEENEEVLSGDSSEADDCNLGKSTIKKKHGGKDSAFAKTYQKKKVKNAPDQQMIISFASPSFRIPKVTQMCPMCQKEFLLSSLEEHVQKCVQLDDERKSNDMSSDRS